MKLFVWTDFDLDGTGSLMIVKWLYPDADVSFMNTKVSAFRDDFIKWTNAGENIDKYDAVFFLDLDVSTSIDLVDTSKSVIIDHHLSHFENIKNYKHAKVAVEEFTSCVLLMYKMFKSKLKLTTNQKKLILMIDDFDCYKLQINESLMLNYLFTDLQKGEYKSKVDRFIAEFNDGFDGFNPLQLNIINFYKNKIQRIIEDCEYFEGELSIQKKLRRIKSAITDAGINDVCEYILNEGYDLAITFNPKTNAISFRTRCSDLDVSKVAEKLCNGGGHRYAAGGKLTDTFVEFTKLLKRVK